MKHSARQDVVSLTRTAAEKIVDAEAVFTLPEVSTILQISVESAKAMFEDGEIAGISLNKRHAVILRSDLVAYLRRTAEAQTSVRRTLSSSQQEAHLGSDGATRALTSRNHRGRRSRPLPFLGDGYDTTGMSVAGN